MLRESREPSYWQGISPDQNMTTLTLPNLLALEKRLDEIPFAEIGNSIPESMNQLSWAKRAQA
ncbi:MAG: hypothetical protein CMO60_09465 [Verrucomicrobiales bacterium]|nr:hypothetical protein [Verrucomicrobiales bacterium]